MGRDLLPRAALPSHFPFACDTLQVLNESAREPDRSGLRTCVQVPAGHYVRRGSAIRQFVNQAQRNPAMSSPTARWARP